jgi:hypothetical protein
MMGPLLASYTTTVETRHNVQNHFYEDFATMSPLGVTTNSQKPIAARSNTSNPLSPTGQYEDGSRASEEALFNLANGNDESLPIFLMYLSYGPNQSYLVLLARKFVQGVEPERNILLVTLQN